MRHYAPRACAVLSLGPLNAVSFPKGRSGRIPSLDPARRPLATDGLGLGCQGISVALPLPGPKCGILFVTSHTGLENRYYAWLPRLLGTKVIAIVHDLIPIENPEYCRPREFAKHSTRVRTALKASAVIATNPHEAPKELQEHCEEHALALPRTLGAPFVPSLPPLAPARRGTFEPYFVFLSTIEPCKNHWMLLHVWRQMVRAIGSSATKLLLIGRWGWESENVVDLLESSRILKRHVFESGLVSRRRSNRVPAPRSCIAISLVLRRLLAVNHGGAFTCPPSSRTACPFSEKSRATFPITLIQLMVVGGKTSSPTTQARECLARGPN